MPETAAVTGPGSDGRKTPLAGDAAKPAVKETFKIADVRESDVTVEMEDGRVFVARVGDNIDEDDLKRGREVIISSDGLDKSDAPKDAVVSRVVPKKD